MVIPANVSLRPLVTGWLADSDVFKVQNMIGVDPRVRLPRDRADYADAAVTLTTGWRKHKPGGPRQVRQGSCPHGRHGVIWLGDSYFYRSISEVGLGACNTSVTNGFASQS